MDQRQVDQVLQVIRDLASAGTTEFRPGHIADALRAVDDPMGTWQIRSILSRLEADGLIAIDEQTSHWSLRETAAQSRASR